MMEKPTIEERLESTFKQRLKSYHKPNMIPRYHESCKHHELRQIMNYDKNEEECPYEIHIKCLKGHKLTETSVNDCNDYELTDEDFMWKFDLIRDLVRGELSWIWGKDIPYRKE